MATPDADPDREEDTPQQRPESPPPTPRWVKLFGIVGLVLILLLIGGLLLFGGEHGPGRHRPGAVVTSVERTP